MTRSHWRFAAGAGLLAAGLVANASGAMAGADVGSGATGSADGADPSSHSSTPAPATGPLGGFSATVRATIQGAADALNPGQLLRPNSTVGSTGSTTQSPIIAVPQMIADAIRVPPPITGLSVARQNPATPTTDPVTPSPATGAHNSFSAQNDVSNAVTSLSTALASTTNQLAQATNQVAQAASTVVAPASAAVAAGVQSVVTPIDAGLTSVTAPIPDVLTALQSMITSTITSTADAIVPLTQVPSDLASMFGITGGVQPVSGRVGGDTNGPPVTELPTPLQTARPLVLDHAWASAISDDASGAAQAAATPSGATSAMAAASARNATARTAPVDAMSEGLKQFVQTYGALVVAASLSALIAAALPGILAFLIPTAAGVGVGYRQARAGIALGTPGLGRFAGIGPIGIVRTGSMVTPRRSALRVARPARGEVASPSPVAA